MYHIHNISNTPFFMSDIIFMYDRIGPTKPTAITILWYETDLFLRRGEEPTLSPWNTPIEHVPESYTWQLINFLMGTSLLMMMIKILYFRQIHLNNLLLIKLIITHITKDVNQYFNNLLINLLLCEFHDTIFKLLIPCHEYIYLIEMTFCPLSIKVPWTG